MSRKSRPRVDIAAHKHVSLPLFLTLSRSPFLTWCLWSVLLAALVAATLDLGCALRRRSLGSAWRYGGRARTRAMVVTLGVRWWTSRLLGHSRSGHLCRCQRFGHSLLQRPHKRTALSSERSGYSLADHLGNVWLLLIMDGGSGRGRA